MVRGSVRTLASLGWPLMSQDMSDDPFDLARFVEAQDADGTYQRALGELRAGNKTSHWMWFVFPQVAGLGLSATSVRYAISGLPEAQAYLRHTLLGSRLLECTSVLIYLHDLSAELVLGTEVAANLRSSITYIAYS